MSLRRGSMAALGVAAFLVARLARAQDAPIAPAPGPAVQNEATENEPPRHVKTAEEREEANANRGRFLVKLAAGGAYRRIFAVPIYGGEVSLSLGGGTRKIAFYFDANAMWGMTEYRLKSGQFDLGGSFEGTVEPFHIGINAHLSYMYMTRITADDTMDSLGIGITPYATVDLFTWDEHALLIGAKLPLDVYNGNPAPGVWGVTAFLGLRL